jgi:hypothetical protein
MAVQPIRIKTISEYHQIMGLPKPEHPLVSVINFESIKKLPYTESISLIFDFYSISLKKLIEKAKEKLSTTDLSVSEIAYELGFEHPQSFSKLFKTKTSLSPLEFRHSFN